jgi:hypothetical protein
VRQINHILFDNDSKHLDRFGLLLVVTVLAIVGQMLFNQNLDEASVQRTLVATVVNLLVALALLLAIRAAGLRRRWTRIADILVGIGLVGLLLIVVVELSTGRTGDGISITSPSVVAVVLALFSPVAVVWRLGQHRKVTIATLLGAVSGFLLIANAFNFAFRALDSVTSTPFFGSVEPTTVYMYFSLVTVTTTGYGDFAPVTEFGRLLATTEAILGQVYLVTVVAMAVGLYAQQQVSARKQLLSDPGSSTPTADSSPSD